MTRLHSRILTTLLGALALLVLSGSTPVSQDDAEYHRQREAYAEDNFATVMGNNDWNLVQSQRRPAASPAAVTATPATSTTAEVVVPLDRYEAVRAVAEAMDRADRQPEVPLVVLGASSYTGRALDGALSLRLELGVTLGGEGLWKTVPLVGEEVVVVRARDAATGTELPLTRQSGYHVWLTPRVGEVTVELDLLVPSMGRRGSLEYDFLVARTPVTRFECSFPSAGLEPRLRSAVRSEVVPADGGVRLSASLEPTSRIHLMGFKDVGEDEGRQARIYAESLNLLSVDEGGLDLFTVVSFDILYAGAQHFDVLIPEGMTVVSADGQGAFRYTLEPADGGTLLRGETAYPIRNAYEISLRLRREQPRDSEVLDLQLPRCQGVEREYGWLGVEVVGNLRLEELEQREVLAVDVRQLPWEMVQSAVSPILRAYRYHSADAGVVLEAQRLPEREPATGSIDLVEATTTISREGAMLTDMRITLRNRLRHSLSLELPAGMEVRSALLGNEPVKPGVADDGTLTFPLQRSAGGADLQAFTLQVVLEQDLGGLAVLGTEKLALPAVGLPVSTVRWEVHLPANNDYTRLEGELKPQTQAGSGRWFSGGVAHVDVLNNGRVVAQTQEPAASAGTGAMPVRIELPTEGKRMSYERYWLEADTPVQVSTWYVRSWLLPQLVLLAVALAAGLAWLLGLHRRAWGLARSVGGQVVATLRRPAVEREEAPQTAWAKASPGGQLVLLAMAGLACLMGAILLLRLLVLVV